jgi:hypothetical protein
MAKNIETSVHIDNTPEAVIGYVADARHRPLFLPSLKSISDLKEQPGGVGTTWKWTWVALGMEWSGIGRCLKSEAGKLYSFKTEGGIESTWTYAAEKDGSGTKLNIRVDYEIPEKAKSKLPSDTIVDKMKKTETEQVVQNLKMILDK